MRTAGFCWPPTVTCATPDIWLICWTNQQDTGFHDHDLSAGAVHIVEGELVEDRFEFKGSLAAVVGVTTDHLADTVILSMQSGTSQRALAADQMLIEMAKSLRIDTQGKTREEVSQAIMERVSSPKPEPTKPVDAPQTTSADAPQTELGETQAGVVVQQAEPKPDLPAVD